MTDVNAGTIKARIMLENRDFRRGMQQARQDMRAFESESLRQARQLKISQSQIKTGLMGIGTASVAAIGASIMTAARFEQSMAKVKAISGATGEEFDALKQTAKDLGATTAYSSSQASEGMALLAAAGFKTNEIIDAMPGLLNLAGAAQLDLATSADYLGSIMSGFGIKAKDSSHAVDVLVQAMNDANTDLPDLAEAMKYVAPVAASMKIPFEDTAAAIALMSNYGIRGSQAGTTLRSTLLSMANPVGQAEEAMKKLGISYKNANGEMKPLPEILNHVSKKMSGLTEAQKTQYAAMLVGTEASSGFLALLNEGGDTLTDFADKLRTSDGAAADMAATMKNTLLGEWDNFTSAIEGLGINIGEEFLPEAKAVVGVATDLVDALSKVNPQFIELALKMAAGGSAAGVLYFSLAKLPLLFRSLQLAMGPAGWIALGAGAIAGALLDVKDATDEVKVKTTQEIKAIAESANALEAKANRYDLLRAKMKWTNDQFADYLDNMSKMSKTSDKSALAKLAKEQENLAKKSGLSKKEIEELVSINKELGDKVASTTDKVTEEGTVMVTSTRAVRELTAAKRDQVLAELELKKAKAAADHVKNVEKEKRLTREVAQMTKELAEREERIKQQKRDVANAQEDYNDKLKHGNVITQKFAKNVLENKKSILQESQDYQVSLMKRRNEAQRTLEKIREQLRGEKQINNEMASIILKQVGLNGNKRNGLRLIDEEIQKTGEAIQKTNAKAKAGKLSNKEAKELVRQYVDHLNQLNEAKGLLGQYVKLTDKGKNGSKEQAKAWKELQSILKKNGYEIDKSTGQVRSMNKEVDKTKEKAKDANKELGKKVTKEVKTDDKGSNLRNHKEAIKPGVKDVKTDDKGSNKLNHDSATKSGIKTVRADDRGSNDRLHRAATKSGSKNITLHSGNFSSWLYNITKPVSKTVNLVGHAIGSAWNKITGKRHSGGTLHELPKYHNGGSPALDGLGGSFERFTPPKFDEVDVRLLRNEMVLTQGQQANLFRMISSFGEIAESRVKSAAAAPSVIQTGPKTITIQTHLNGKVLAETVVDDITELQNRKQQQAARARGDIY
ncbi:phage tail tape measure protein [Fictibacillus sp. Mic-4]|uniref:phage tail tape measure protein n=1 Tax=Fictibacillus sp. Mic-4 TaxID=3132826 RepID=UPI003CF24D92